MRPEAPLFFANVDRMLALVRHQIEGAEGSVQTLILSLEESPDLDGTCVEALVEFAEFTHRREIELLFARVHDTARDVLSRCYDAVGLGNAARRVLA